MTVRWVWRLFAGALRRRPDVFTGERRRFAIAQSIIRAFYAFGLFFLANTVLSEFAKLSPHPPVSPLWPLAWLDCVNPTLGLRALGGGCALALVAAAVAPGWRSARIAGWLALLEFAALKNSYGKIGHSLHLSIWVAFILIALPPGWTRGESRAVRQRTLLVVWTCQAAILLSYTMSGLGKLGGAVYQTFLGQPSAFTPGGVGAHVAERLLQTHSQSGVGTWIVAHPYLTWPLMPGAIAVEFFSFWTAFRPSLQRPWAIALIAFHLGVYLAMTIDFPQNCFLLALFFFSSPFEPNGLRLVDRLADLPFGQKALQCAQVIRQRFGQQTGIDGTGGSGQPL